MNDAEDRVTAGISAMTAVIARLTLLASCLWASTATADNTLRCWGSGWQCGQIPPLTNPSQISVGRWHSVALSQSGTVDCWITGSALGQCNLPAGLTGIVRLAAGHAHTVGLRSNGTVVCWGFNGQGQCNVPVGLSGVSQVSAGEMHSMALRSSGTVICWGDNSSGQCNVPQGTAGISGIAAGYRHSIALRSNGTVTCWGSNEYGESSPPAGLTNVTQVEGGGFIPAGFSMALRSDGSVVCWGFNGFGECNVPAGLTGVMKVSAGLQHSMALRGDGTVVCWGSNSNGQCNVPAGLSNAIDIEAGSSHSLAFIGVPDCNGDGVADIDQIRAGALADYDCNDVPDCCERGDPCVVGHYPVQWREQDGGNGHWYWVRDTELGWQAAHDAASSFGAHLVTVTSAAERGFLAGLALPQGIQRGLWSGGVQSGMPCGPACGWTWTTGEPWSFSDWGTGEPNDGRGEESRLEILRTPLKTWNDESGTTAMHWIMEWSGDCNGDGYIDYGQILNGQLSDANIDGIPDSCRRVPQDSPTIQAAIDASSVSAVAGIVVAPGTYFETLDLSGKRVRIMGAGPASTTIHAPMNSQMSVIRAVGEPTGALIQGVTVRGGMSGTMLLGGSPVRVGGGIFGDGSALVLKDSVIEANSSALGGGAYLRNCTGSILGCVFRDNQASEDGGGVFLHDGEMALQQTVVTDNYAGNRGGGIHVVGGRHLLRRVDVESNGCGNVVGGLSFVWLSSFGPPIGQLTIDGCNVMGNAAFAGYGGIGILDETPGDVQVSIAGSQVCSNAPPNVTGAWTDLGQNLVCDCWADLNRDGRVDGADLSSLLSQWGPATPSTSCDFDVSGSVDSLDLAYVLAAWGPCSAQAPPTLAAVSPGVGTSAGGTQIAIGGANLMGVVSVTIGGVPATEVRVQSGALVVAVTPPGTLGPKDVTVTGPSGSATLPGGFAYVAPQPTLSGVSPSVGGTVGGTRITLTGTNLEGTTTVTVGGVAATDVQVVSSTTVTAVVPPGPAGSALIAVLSPSGSADLPGSFLYADGLRPSWATVMESMPSPSIVTDPGLRHAIRATGYAWRVRHTLSGIDMVLIPPGTFGMGCSPATGSGCDGDELPVHPVSITYPFYIGQYELTQSQWVARMGTNPSLFRQENGFPNWAARPVERVTWDAAQQFVSLTAMRLPTEAEWEHAYRASTTTAFHGFPAQPSGTNDPSLAANIAWFSGGPGFQTSIVGQKQANGLGLYDMGGNVWEWVGDWYASNYYASSPSVNPAGPMTGTHRVLRGGSWDLGPISCRSSAREPMPPSSFDSGITAQTIGFRVAKDP